jgi:hypothetical protein
MTLRRPKLPFIAALACALFYVTWLGRAQGNGQSAMSQRTFPSMAEATNALVKAIGVHDREAICDIFGPDGTNLMTGDKSLDDRHFQKLASDLATRCVILPEGSNGVFLEVGEHRWLFPIPLVQTNGTWSFDTAAGQEEIINRHIGRDEYYAIGVCRAYVKAQQEYSKRFAADGGTPKYAQRFKSEEGKMDGLYWPAENGGAPSPFSSFLAEASTEGYHWGHGKGAHPFHGYFFKILTRQGPAASGGKMNYIRAGAMTGGFALVAYPVRWGESGIMTFVVNQDGIVYQRNLGEKTASRGAAMKEYNPDEGWTVVSETGIDDLTPDTPDPNVR